MSWKASFGIDASTVRSVEADIISASLSSEIATFTTDGPHGFSIGTPDAPWYVTVTGLGDPYDGTFPLRSVTETEFTVKIIADNVATATVSGRAYSPSPSYVRYQPGDTRLDNLASLTSLYVEPWDYNTIRVVWGLDADLEEIALNDISEYGLVPRVAITRSGFGYPVTPLDGEKILDKVYTDVVGSIDRTNVLPYFETQPGDVNNSFNRPPVSVQSLYDRNLESGHWFYYSLFFYLQGSSEDGPFWRIAKSASALTPVNHGHGDILYSLIPNYYQSKDQEFSYGTGRQGTLQRLTDVIGFELDYTKTLADGLEHVYDVDTVQRNLLYSLGESNFGVAVESGLGDIRYRSLLSTVSRLYDERGSISGLQKMVTAATKYRCKILEGINMMSLTDDSEFSSGTGSWGDVYESYPTFIDAEEWGGGTITAFNPVTLESVTLNTIDEVGNSIVTRRNAMKITKSSGSGTDSMITTCGLGVGNVENRRHYTEATSFYPRLHGIKCEPGVIYTFSSYIKRVNTADPSGNVVVGIMWFNDLENGQFDITNDYISKTESFPEADSSTNMTRYYVDSEAPLSLRGQPYVFAVPYVLFENSYEYYVSACMFNSQLNSASSFALEANRYLTLGIESEKLGSDFILGDVT